jgi:hypothetical protein
MEKWGCYLSGPASWHKRTLHERRCDFCSGEIWVVYDCEEGTTDIHPGKAVIPDSMKGSSTGRYGEVYCGDARCIVYRTRASAARQQRGEDHKRARNVHLKFSWNAKLPLLQEYLRFMGALKELECKRMKKVRAGTGARRVA